MINDVASTSRRACAAAAGNSDGAEAMGGAADARRHVVIDGRVAVAVGLDLAVIELRVDLVEALGAEGMEISVPARGSVRPVLRDMLKHLCSAISYGGAGSLSELQKKFRESPERYVIRLTESSRRESFDR